MYWQNKRWIMTFKELLFTHWFHSESEDHNHNLVAFILAFEGYFKIVIFLDSWLWNLTVCEDFKRTHENWEKRNPMSGIM